MSERVTTCKALAAMIQASGDPTVDELRFIAHVALELGLSEDENAEVQAVLETGGDFSALAKKVEQRDMQLFLFRQVVAAALIDDHINNEEHSYINTAAEAFDIGEDLRAAFIAWMHEGMEWERRGAGLLDQMRESAS